MQISSDAKGQPYIEWEQRPGGIKRAWIQKNKAPGKNWAEADRYLNVVRCNDWGRPGGNATDFPIFNDLPDEDILRAFVYAASAITGCSLDVEQEGRPRSE